MALFFSLPWLLIWIPLYLGEDLDWYKESRHRLLNSIGFLGPSLVGIVMLSWGLPVVPTQMYKHEEAAKV